MKYLSLEVASHSWEVALEHNLTSASPQHAASLCQASHVCKVDTTPWIGFSSGCSSVPAVRASWLLTDTPTCVHFCHPNRWSA
jgi:hypothetical protein